VYGARASPAATGVVIGLILVLASFWGSTGTAAAFGAGRSTALNGAGSGPGAPLEPLAAVLASPLDAVAGAAADVPVPSSAQVAIPLNSTVSILVTLAVENQTHLSSLLADLQDPGSPEYHRYLSAAAFTREFAPNASAYATVADYFGSFGVSGLTTYPGRLAVSFSASPATLSRVLHTDVERLAHAGTDYWAAAAPPALPSPIAAEISGLTGIGQSSLATPAPQAGIGSGYGDGGGMPRDPAAGGPPAPVTNGSTQYLYPSDLQVAYDEESLFAEYGYPKTANVAAILWDGLYLGTPATAGTCGSLTTGENVGAYDPSDLSSFFSNVTPGGEPLPTVTSITPAGGNPPSCLASWDTSGVVAANTAELEAMGEMVPGANIDAISVPGPSIATLLEGVETILSPPSSLPSSVRDGLANVSVVAVGWAENDTPDSQWVTYLEQAAARGLTVVAASGDSGDNVHSPHWDGTDAQFPATAGTAASGSLAVGGVTATLNASTDHLASEVVWNVSAGGTVEDGPAGSAGGISSGPFQYTEPAYQVNSSANQILKGRGRGVPDVAAVANNTLITLTVKGNQSVATNASSKGLFTFAFGTGLAAAIVAGLLTDVDYVLESTNSSPLGFVNPSLYALANETYTPAPSNAEVTSTVTGAYDSYLPTSPFYDVIHGSNDVYSAGAGYDLATGWGTIDAYNLTMYYAHPPTGGVYGDLAGIRTRVHLGQLSVTSRLPSGGLERIYNGSIQQNFFVANALGAPVYWAQSVLYLALTPSGFWAVNFTANLTYPFPSLYPTISVHEVYWPHGGEQYKLPLTPTLTTTLLAANGSVPPELKFEYGLPGIPTLTLNVPGAAFIIGRLGYSYSWQGVTYTDGPKNGESAPAFLAPQFVLVGAPPDCVGTFGSPTSGSLSASVEALGSTVYAPADTGVITVANTQTAASGLDLLYTETSTATYNYTYSGGGTDQGVYEAEAPYYALKFSQTGAPDGATWYVNLSNGVRLSGSGSTTSLTVPLQNGTYNWTAAIDVRNWSSTPSSDSVTIAGRPVAFALAFGPAVCTVTFKAKGPESGTQLAIEWFVNLSGSPLYAGEALSFETNLSFGTYTYTLACNNTNFVATKPSGTIDAGPTPLQITADFVVRTYPVIFIFHMPKPAVSLTISLGSYSDKGVFNTWTLDEPKGTYSWSISGLPFGYGAIPAGGTVVVNGPVTPIMVTISTTGWGPFGLGVVGYILIGVVVGLVAVWVTVALWRRSKRRRRERAMRRPPEPEEPPAAVTASPGRPY